MPRLLALLALSIAGVSSLAASACSRGDSTPPVAKVSVTTNRQRVNVGGPIEMTYRFEVLPGAAIADNYRVFVHVLNQDGQPLWGDDHDPVTPTSAWKPGQVIEYKRERFVPSMSATGEASVEVGLYRENDRLPLQAIETAGHDAQDRSYRVASFQILPESDNVFLIYKSGWHPEEFAANDPMVAWKWTKKSGVLSLRNPKMDCMLVLQYDARPDVFGAQPQQVTISVNDKTVERFIADSDDIQIRRVPLSAAQLGSNDMVEVKFDLDRTFVPAQLPGGSRDSRELGIRVYHVFVDTGR